MRKKNKFLTLIFACLPGAGHMYLGFMKLGLSFMILFFGVFGLAILADSIIYFLSVPILMIAPIIWFYAFFDCINKNGASDEEFASYQDYYLFYNAPELQNINFRFNFDFFNSKAPRLAVGFIILISGITMLCRNILNIIGWNYYWEQFELLYNLIHNILNVFPQVTISIAIIVLGVWLIRGKRKELHQEYQEIKELAEHHEN